MDSSMPSFKEILSRADSSSSFVVIKEKSQINGLPAIPYSDEELQSFAKPLEFSPMGKFPKGRPSLEIIREHFIGLKLHQQVSIGILNNRSILIRLQCIEDYSKAIPKRYFFSKGFHVRVLKWSPYIDYLEESLLIPVWIAFPLLRVHLFNPSALFSLGSLFGTPLQVDPIFVKLIRPSIARVLVEMDVSQKPQDKIWIGTEENGYIQRVIFKNLPRYCTSCKIHGHHLEDCRRKCGDKDVGSAMEKENEPPNDVGEVMLEKSKVTVEQEDGFAAEKSVCLQMNLDLNQTESVDVCSLQPKSPVHHPLQHILNSPIQNRDPDDGVLNDVFPERNEEAFQTDSDLHDVQVMQLFQTPSDRCTGTNEAFAEVLKSASKQIKVGGDVTSAEIILNEMQSNGKQSQQQLLRSDILFSESHDCAGFSVKQSKGKHCQLLNIG